MQERRFTVLISKIIAQMLWATCRLTLSSGERSVEVDAESEDMAEGGLAWPDRSEREVEVLTRDKISEEILLLELTRNSCTHQTSAYHLKSPTANFIELKINSFSK